MGKPAARLGDMTAHGGSIVVGCPTVMIGGKPAARVGDMHTCPMQTPAAPSPIPHVGGPIAVSSAPTVLIGGTPAACVGDMATCVGPPDSIAPPGCPTVLIGPGGGGGGGAGKGGGGKAALEKALSSVGDALEPGHFLDLKFTDKGGFPITGLSYKLTGPDKKVQNGLLTGSIKQSGVDEGEYEIELAGILDAQWSETAARDGDKVKMQVKTAGIEDGVAAIFWVMMRDLKRADKPIAYIRDKKVDGGKIEAEWSYEYSENTDEGDGRADYSYPKFYFIVQIGQLQSRSGILDYKDWIELELLDENGDPLKDEEYEVKFSSGEVRRGKLDGNGQARLEGIPTASHTVSFPAAGDIISEGVD